MTSAPTLASPLLDRPGAVPGDGPDAGVARHYGDPLREQRALVRGAGWVDRSTRGVLAVPGPDRLSWLHSITSQHLSGLADGTGTEGLVLSPHGHVEQHFVVAELAGTTWLDTEPGTAPALLAYLDSMRFLLRVEPRDATAELAVLTVAGPDAAAVLTAAGLPAPSLWAVVPARRRRLRPAHPGARGRPARAARLADRGGRPAHARPGRRRSAAGRTRRCGSRPGAPGSASRPTTARSRTRSAGSAPRCTWTRAATAARRRWPGCTTWAGRRAGWCCCTCPASGTSCRAPGTPLLLDGRTVGFLGTAVQHHELGPVALGVVKRTVADGTVLDAAGNPAAVDGTD